MKTVKVEFFNVYLKKGNKVITIPFYGKIKDEEAIKKITSNFNKVLAAKDISSKDIARLKKKRPKEFKMIKQALLSRFGCLYAYKNPDSIILTDNLSIGADSKKISPSKRSELIKEAEKLANESRNNTYKWLISRAKKLGFEVSNTYVQSYSEYCKNKIKTTLATLKSMIEGFI